MMEALWVALGAAVGAPLRFWLNHLVREHGGTPQAGTLVVNVLGSLVLGWLVGAGMTGSWLALAGIGFCGALTTFSTLALEIWEAMTDDRRVHAVSAAVSNLVLGLAAAFLGYALGG